jgi:hypothetical protein
VPAQAAGWWGPTPELAPALGVYALVVIAERIYKREGVKPWVRIVTRVVPTVPVVGLRPVGHEIMVNCVAEVAGLVPSDGAPDR